MAEWKWRKGVGCFLHSWRTVSDRDTGSEVMWFDRTCRKCGKRQIKAQTVWGSDGWQEVPSNG